MVGVGSGFFCSKVGSGFQKKIVLLQKSYTIFLDKKPAVIDVFFETIYLYNYDSDYSPFPLIKSQKQGK